MADADEMPIARLLPMTSNNSSFSISSARNGRIDVRPAADGWQVYVGGYDQSTDYCSDMWRQALRFVPARARVKRVLMLGLGAGVALPHVFARFPESRVTVVEWDPAMVEVAERAGYVSTERLPDVLVGDAADIVPSLGETFDLILVDLFRGDRAAPILEQSAFVRALAARLRPHGFLLLNYFKSRRARRAFDAVLGRYAEWRFAYNGLAAYRPVSGGVHPPSSSGFFARLFNK